MNYEGKLYSMKKYLLTIVALFLNLPLTHSVAEESSDYRFGPGDYISISVYGEVDLSINVRIGSSGSISYPFLGDVAVKGLTAKQLEKKLIDGLKGPYLVDPNVTVSMLEYRPFYVNGEVKRPGSYPFQPGLTVERAISIAGGFTDRASRSKLSVERDGIYLKDSEENSRVKRSVKLQDAVMPGDVLSIEQSFF